MELRHLRYFVAVADAGSLTQAAEQVLHTAQPSLSRQIRALEDEVGTPLLARSAQGIALTEAGKAFLGHARAALLQADAAKEAALRAAQPVRPVFALGFLSGAEMDLLPQVDRALRAQFPDIDIRLSSDYSPALAKALVRRKLDAAFMRAEEHMEDLAFSPVRSDALVFVLPADHQLAAQASLAARDIADENFYLPSRASPAVRRAVLDFFRADGIEIAAGLELHNVVHAISMITSTRAITMLPAYTARYLPPSLVTRPARGGQPALDLSIAYHRANTSPILKELLVSVKALPQ